MRAKDKPNPKDLVIETNANDPYNVPKEVVERQKVDEISQNPKDYRQKNPGHVPVRTVACLLAARQYMGGGKRL